MKKPTTLIPFYKLSGAALAIGLLSGCATVTTGSSQPVTINTTPEGAKCTLSREGAMIAAISSTPGTVTIDKSKNTIQLACEKPGHQVTNESLVSNFQGATLGNILIGGVIGLAIDAGSGAMNKYPNLVEVVLIPEQFANAEERDQFFDLAEEKIREREALALQKIDNNCFEERECTVQREAVQAEVGQRLEKLKQQRANAKAG